MNNYIVGIVVVVVLSAAARFAQRASIADVDVSRAVLRPIALFKIMGWLGVAMCAGVALHVALLDERHDYHYIFFGFLIMLIGGLSFASFAESRRRIELSARGIVGYSPWSRKIEIPWEAVTSIRTLGLYNNTLAIRGAGNQVITVDPYMNGAQTLIDYFQRHLDSRMYLNPVSRFAEANGGTLRVPTQTRKPAGNQ